MTKASNKNEGYICLHRKIRNDWKWKNPIYRSAWDWILVNAEWNPDGYNGLERGQVRFSVTQSQELWGMSPTTAKRFLKRCEEDGSIIWSRGYPGRKFQLGHGPINGPISGPISDPKAGIITVLNYNKYQAPPNQSGPISGPIGNPISGPLTNTSSNTSTNKKSTRKPKTKKQPYHDSETFIEDARAIDLQPYRDKYGPKGVHVEDILDLLILHATLDENDPKHLSNKEYRSIPLTLHTYCSNDIRYNGERTDPYFVPLAQRPFNVDDDQAAKDKDEFIRVRALIDQLPNHKKKNLRELALNILKRKKPKMKRSDIGYSIELKISEVEAYQKTYE